MFHRGEEVLAEDPKSTAVQSEDYVGVGPGIVVAPRLMARAREGLGGCEYFEFTRGALVLRQRGGRGNRVQRRGEQDVMPPSWHGKDRSPARIPWCMFHLSWDDSVVIGKVRMARCSTLPRKRPVTSLDAAGPAPRRKSAIRCFTHSRESEGRR